MPLLTLSKTINSKIRLRGLGTDLAYNRAVLTNSA